MGVSEYVSVGWSVGASVDVSVGDRGLPWCAVGAAVEFAVEIAVDLAMEIALERLPWLVP